jgi:hypothetical protein
VNRHRQQHTPDTPLLTNDKSYWLWFGVALFLLIPVDMLTTAGAIARHGVAGELNPVMQTAFQRGTPALLGLNLAAVLLSSCGFGLVLVMFRRAPYWMHPYLDRWLQVWLGLLVSVGLFVAVNNLLALVAGKTLLGPWVVQIT